MSQSLIIISDRHGNNNKRLICDHCKDDIKIRSKVMAVRVEHTVVSLRFRYHIECWNKLNKEADK